LHLKAGIYKFANDINWQPTGIFNIGITIVASNVTIDLSQYTFRCLANNTFSTGIFAFNCDNISIINGSIKNMGLIGVGGSNINTMKISNINLSELTLNNLLLPGVGIAITNSTHINIKCVRIKNIEITGLTLAAILLDNVVDSKIYNCTFYNLKNNSGVCSGLAQITCDKSSTKNLNINKLETGNVDNPTAPGHTCIGVVPFQCSSFYYNKMTRL
jgi:hypothetical protein